MFFLLRCAFWLGLVFSHLPWDGEAVRNDVASGAAQASAAAVEKAQSLCLKDPVACARHSAAVGKALGVGASHNTLMASDLAPVWKGGQRPSPPHRPSN
ncbi:MAG: hypothetical protein JWL93_1286 [Hyphomicrobiales bacterium]|nr:hypothetical protein [Hyphomicrobiales bacterium]